MADFVAVLNKTIDGLGERNTLEMRKKVYERAHRAIADKLSAVTPTPTAAQSDRQFQLLNEAIATVEANYVKAPKIAQPPAPAVRSDPLADYLNATETGRPELVTAVAPPEKIVVTPQVSQTIPSIPAVPTRAERDALYGDPVLALDREVQTELGINSIPRNAPKKRGFSAILLGLVALLVIGGAGLGGYFFKDQIEVWFSKLVGKTEVASLPVAPVETVAKAPAVAIEPEALETPETPAAEAPLQKLTQRLTEDGEEVDTGPGAVPTDVGEGASVAPVTTPATGAQGATTPAAADPVVAVPEAIIVGQKAVFYEEKTGTEQGTADQGAVVWSVVQDSPGLDQPPEPAIRGEVNITNNGVKVRITIKRNVDKTLPASHIVEMLFTTPPEFAGGVIENVQRVAMKDTEQAPGNPLVGVPAAFGDGFFLIALTDEKSAIETNLSLLSKQQWMDIPVTYGSGRRALLSFEKGIPGDKVFSEVIKAWEAKSATAG